MKNKILKTITGIAALGALTTGCMFDSVSKVPFILFTCCVTWLALFCYVNSDRLL